MRFLSFLLALAATLVASPALAQHCWPSSFALVVRDGESGVLNPQALDSVAYTPQPSSAVDFRVIRRGIDPANGNAMDGATPTVYWFGRGACQVDVREVVLRRGGEVMRLWMDVHINTLARPGSSQFALKTPPFATGTWRLDVCALPPGKMNAFAWIPERWTRVSESGDAGTPPEAPHCQGGETR